MPNVRIGVAAVASVRLLRRVSFLGHVHLVHFCRGGWVRHARSGGSSGSIAAGCGRGSGSRSHRGSSSSGCSNGCRCRCSCTFCSTHTSPPTDTGPPRTRDASYNCDSATVSPPPPISIRERHTISAVPYRLASRRQPWRACLPQRAWWTSQTLTLTREQQQQQLVWPPASQLSETPPTASCVMNY